jgi:Phage-related protein
VKINALLSVKFFKTESGSEPVRDWLLEDLTIAERKVVGRDIKVMQMSWPIGMPLVKSIGSGLWEVRSNLENKLARVLFTFHNNEIILLYGFVKKSQKILKKDLELAKQRKSLFKKG